MRLAELRMAVDPIRFLEFHLDSPAGMVELADRPVPKLLVWHPETVEWLFRSDSRLRHSGGRSLTSLFGERSLLWAEDARHTAYRRVLGPPLRGKGLADRHDLIAGAVRAAVDVLTPGVVVDVLAWSRVLALRVIAGLLLGRYDEDLLAAVSRWIERAFGSRYRTLGFRYLLGGLPQPGAGVDSMLVAAAKAGTDLRPPTLAARLLEDGPLGGIDDGELRSALVSMLVAGHETTAAGTAWTLYWLDRHPRLRQEVRDELVDGADGSDPARVPLLHAVMCEALRLTPPATLAVHRVLPEETELLGRTLPAGSVLKPTMYAAHRDPEAFPNPLRFDPGRFLDGRPSPHRYFPFGGGTRYCLGSQLAQLEIRMINAALLRARDWQTVRPRAGVARMRGNVLAPAGFRLRVLSCRD